MKIRLHLLSCLVFLVAVVPLYTQDVVHEAGVEKPLPPALKTNTPAEKTDVTAKETDGQAQPAPHDSEVSSPKEEIQTEGKYFFGALQTTVYTDVATVQSTVYMYCVVGQATSPACTGKKRRRRNTLNQEIDILSSDKSSDGLSTSLQTASELKSESNDGKLAGFIVWTTSRTTTTVTVLTTNTATSIRLSILCTAANIIPPSIGCLTIAAG